MATIYIDVETKPNNCLCRCGVCGNRIKKGEKRFNLSCAGWKASKNWFFHLVCLPKALQRMAIEGEGSLNSST